MSEAAAAIAHFAMTIGLPEVFPRDDRLLGDVQAEAFFGGGQPRPRMNCASSVSTASTRITATPG